MDETNEKPVELPGTDDALDVSSTFANFFNVTRTSGVVRITFGEALGPGTRGRFRQAVTLLDGDARALVDLLDSLLGPPGGAANGEG